MKEVTPYQSAEGKKVQVRNMFDNISANYDFLNHFLSLGIDKHWRKKSINLLAGEKTEKILDVATGTADFALESLRLKPDEVIGIDISEKMLEVGRKKILHKGLGHLVKLEKGDSENMRFDSESFDAVTVGFGVRNFENLPLGLREIHRVLKKGGRVVILEFSHPSGFPLKQVYGLYFRYLLPFLGSIISKDGRAYRYLHESVIAFPEGAEFLEILANCGFSDIRQHRLMRGIASIYVGKK